VNPRAASDISRSANGENEGELRSNSHVFAWKACEDQGDGRWELHDLGVLVGKKSRRMAAGRQFVPPSTEAVGGPLL